MAILNQLGINHTTFYCFLIFVVTFFFLKEILFKPYFVAFEEREGRTKGGENKARDYQSKTEGLQREFEEEARDVSAEIKSIFDETRGLASKEHGKLVTEAKKIAEQVVEETREHVAAEVKKAQEQMRVEIPGVALSITKKMLD